MAMIGGLHVWVKEESISNPVTVATHPIETGANISDYVKPEPATLSITGEIVGDDAQNKVNQLKNWQRMGMVVSYVGRNIFGNSQITEFTIKFTNKITGGCEFTMTLREIAVAQNVFWTAKDGYDGPMMVTLKGNDGTVQVLNLAEPRERTHTLMTGETLWFIAEQYRASGVTVDSLKKLNQDRDVFSPGCKGDFNNLRTGAALLLGSW